MKAGSADAEGGSLPLVELAGVGHAFLGRTVLEEISLSIAAGEVVALLGPSGSGKSTLAHIACGLVTPLSGRIVRRYHRHAMVFQEPRLLPWQTAADNIGFAWRLQKGGGAERGTERGTERRPGRGNGATIGRPASARRARLDAVAAAAEAAGLEASDLDKFPVELSGGMRQRVAIARALVVRPDFVYFDEPFTALDVALKRRLQDLVINAARRDHFGALFITHDLMEAIRISHRLLVLDRHGLGIAGERRLTGLPGERDDEAAFAQRQRFLLADPLFAHIHDVDERQRP